MSRRAIVIGASSGIGAALVRRLAAEGYRVAALARRAELLDELAAASNHSEPRCVAYSHDVRDLDAVRPLFDRVVGELGGLDLVVYAAGVMPQVGPEDYDLSTDREIFEVNTLGAMAWLNFAAERFRQQRSGTIVGIGSVAGDRGRKSPGPAYAASKAALHTYLESLRNRLAASGVRVVTVKPGPVHTPMTAHLDALMFPIEADDAALGIFRAISRGATIAYVPRRWGPIMAVIRAIPSALFRRTNL